MSLRVDPGSIPDYPLFVNGFYVEDELNLLSKHEKAWIVAPRLIEKEIKKIRKIKVKKKKELNILFCNEHFLGNIQDFVLREKYRILYKYGKKGLIFRALHGTQYVPFNKINDNEYWNWLFYLKIQKFKEKGRDKRICELFVKKKYKLPKIIYTMSERRQDYIDLFAKKKEPKAVYSFAEYYKEK